MQESPTQSLSEMTTRPWTNVQTVVSNFLVDIPKGLLDHEVVLWPKIPGTNTNNMSQIINWYRLKCITMDAEVHDFK